MEKPIKSFEELMKHPGCVQALERKISDFTIKKFLIKREIKKLKEEEKRLGKISCGSDYAIWQSCIRSI